MRPPFSDPDAVTDVAIVDLLREWDGRARVWHLNAALDYPDDLDDALLELSILGAIEWKIDPDDADENLAILTEAWR